jgi:hypothetical protein
MTLPGFDGLREYGKRGPTRVATVRTVHAAADRLAVSRWMVYQLGLVDIAGLRQGLQLGLYVVITVLALLALRIVVQVTMLHEEHDDGCPDKPLLCAECEYVVPDPKILCSTDR